MNNKLIEQQAEKAIALQKEIAGKIAELQTTQKQIDETWKKVETAMIDQDIKQIKGDWGTLTIAERLNWAIDKNELAPRYFKTVPDTTKISTLFRLEGKPPKGATPSYTKYLMRKLKGIE